jgi:glycosyltransferase involved in cell wall biosynthesis
MKIIHVLPALTKGGGERIAVELANHASMAGHQVTIIVAFLVDPAFLQDELDPRVQVLCVSSSMGSRIGHYFGIFPWLWCNHAWLAKQDILHCHLTFGAVLGAVVGLWRSLSRTIQPAIVETCHSVGMNISWFKRWSYAQLFKHRDGIAFMAEDDYWKKFILEHPKLHSEIIPNGIKIPSQKSVSHETQKAHRQKLGIPGDCRLVLGTIGRLRSDRKPWLYLPIFAEVARVLGPDIHFVIAGGGAELDRMRLLVAEKGLEGQVHLPGLDLGPNLTRSIMTLYITLNVGQITGIAAMEAAFSNLPVLAVQLLDDYQGGVNDWIWSSPDSRAVAERAVKLIRLPQERQELAERQNAYVLANHTVEKMVDSYFAFYQTAVKVSPTKAEMSA